jgi:hypothetical protein
MKLKLTTTSLFLLALCSLVAHAESPASTEIKITGAERADAIKLPSYVVYRHFLAWINKLDKDAKLSGVTDSYKFAEPFSRANLKHEQLDSLRDAAQRLDAQLQKHQARAQLVISRYRKEANKALAEGKPLPSAPPEIRELERERTALLVQSYINVRAELGQQASAQLDNYLDSEFAPHVKLRRVAEPAPAQARPGN